MKSINTDITEPMQTGTNGDNVWVHNGEPMFTDATVNKYRQTMMSQCRHAKWWPNVNIRDSCHLIVLMVVFNIIIN